MTEAQRAALKWLRDHGCEGVFGKRGGVLLAGGEWAPFARSTWNALRAARLIEWDTRVRVTPAGRAFDYRIQLGAAGPIIEPAAVAHYRKLERQSRPDRAAGLSQAA